MIDLLLSVKIPGFTPVKSGKVREIIDLSDKWLIVTTDRISAYDYILPTGIPKKGIILTMLSTFWFEYLKSICRNHLITSDIRNFPENLKPYEEILGGRSMIVSKAKMFPVECVVRGYLSGSAWKEYKECGKVCSITLPEGLVESNRLPEPIFTPATKAESGHDINITFEEASKLIGFEEMKTIRNISFKIYEMASSYAEDNGIIIADTKFEFGMVDGKMTLCDEIFTPDSSRFWAKGSYNPGGSQASYDKQFVRDYLNSINWNRKPPIPQLPPEIVEQTGQRYKDALLRITGNVI